MTAGALYRFFDRCIPFRVRRVHERTFGWHYFRPICSWNILAHMTWLSLPVAIAVTLHSLNVNIPRYFISHYLNDQNLGIFVALSYIVVGGNMVIMALSLSFSPQIIEVLRVRQPAPLSPPGPARFFHCTSSRSERRVVYLLLWASVPGPGLPSGIRNHVKVLSILMVAAALQYLHGFLRQVMTAARYLIIQLPMYV